MGGQQVRFRAENRQNLAKMLNNLLSSGNGRILSIRRRVLECTKNAVQPRTEWSGIQENPIDIAKDQGGPAFLLHMSRITSSSRGPGLEDRAPHPNMDKKTKRGPEKHG